VLNTRLKCGRPKRQISTTRCSQPIDLVQLEIVQYGLCSFLPGMIKENPLPKRATLTGPVEPDHREANFGQRFQEWVKLLDKRIIAAVEDKCGNFFPLSWKAKSGKMSTGYGTLICS
jgi:hypothetical protein